MKKTVGILQPGYLPGLIFFDQMKKSDIFIILDEVQFTKGDWRNRNRIRTSKGWQWLSVPVLQKGKSKQKIKDVKIDNSKKWQKRHWNLILSYYNKAPCFTEYKEKLSAIYSKKWNYLVDLDMEIISFFKQELCIQTEIFLASELGLENKYLVYCKEKPDPSERNLFYIKELRGNKFYEGMSGKNYLNIKMFYKEGIEIEFQNYSHPKYPQQYSPFIPHLSTLDLILNCGEKSKKIL